MSLIFPSGVLQAAAKGAQSVPLAEPVNAAAYVPPATAAQDGRGSWLDDLFDYAGNTVTDITKTVVEIRKHDLIRELAGIDTDPADVGEQRQTMDESPNNATPPPASIGQGEKVMMAAGGVAAIVGLVLLVK